MDIFSSLESIFYISKFEPHLDAIHFIFENVKKITKKHIVNVKDNLNIRVSELSDRTQE